MFRTCCPTVRPPPTSRGTRIVVSDNGVILSPKYAPQMTAPAATASSSPRTLLMPTNATPSVPAVVHELPGHHAHEGADRGGGEVEPARADQPDAVVDDGGDGSGHVPGADQRADREQDEHRPHRGGHPAHGRLGDRGDRVAVLEGDQARERGAEQQRHLERPVGGAHPEQPDRQREQTDQDDDRQQGVEQAGWSRAARSGRARSPWRPQRPATTVARGPERADLVAAVVRIAARPAEQAHDEHGRHGGDDPADRGAHRPTPLTAGPGAAGRSCSGRHRDPCRARSPRW